jgi:hypothetical protein
VKPRGEECHIFVSPTGDMFVAEPFRSEYVGTYRYDPAGYIEYTFATRDGQEVMSIDFIPKPFK